MLYTCTKTGRAVVVTALSLLLLLPGSGALAQEAARTNCVDVWQQSLPPAELLTSMRAQYLADLTGLTIPDRALKAAVTSDWKELHADLLNNLEQEHFIFQTPLNTLLDSIVDALIAANPTIERPRVLLSWYAWPNASSRGEGTIVVDLGITPRVRDRSELAFVLAHELAHHHLEHVGHSIDEANTRLLSKEFKSSVRAAMRTEYNRTARMEELLIGFSVNARRHSRNHEHEADSMALVFLRGTAFDPTAALSTMDMLDQCDREMDTTNVDLHWAFDHPGVTYDPLWEREERFSSLGAVDTRDRVLEDSLKTHPDCMKRKQTLQLMLGDAEPIAVEAERARYAPLAHAASLALVESAFSEDDIGRAIYLAFQLLKADSGSAYLNASLSRGFSALEVHSGQRTLGMVLKQPSKDVTANYGQLLQVLNRMRRVDFAGLAAHYLQRARACDARCEDTVFAGALLAYAKGNSPELEQSKTEYQKAFPEGRHKQRLAELTLVVPARR